MISSTTHTAYAIILIILVTFESCDLAFNRKLENRISPRIDLIEYFYYVGLVVLLEGFSTVYEN